MWNFPGHPAEFASVEPGSPVEALPFPHSPGSTHLANAADQKPLPDESVAVWFTDPPYFDAVPYADLSDFFLVWLKRGPPDQPLPRDPFDEGNPLSPKTAEAVRDETKERDGQSKSPAWFEATVAKVDVSSRTMASVPSCSPTRPLRVGKLFSRA